MRYLRRKSRSASRQILAALAISLFAAVAVSAETKHPPDTPVDLNVANIKELEQLPGVGPTTAKAIIDFRTKSGRFHRVEDLLVIRGISEAKLKKMRPYITVGPPPAAKPAPPTTKPSPSTAHPPASAPQPKPQSPASASPPKPEPAASNSSPAPQPPASTAPH